MASSSRKPRIPYRPMTYQPKTEVARIAMLRRMVSSGTVDQVVDAAANPRSTRIRGWDPAVLSSRFGLRATKTARIRYNSANIESVRDPLFSGTSGPRVGGGYGVSPAEDMMNRVYTT